MDKLVADCLTGEITQVPETAQEAIERANLTAHLEAQQAAARAAEAERQQDIAAILNPANGCSLDLRQAFAGIVGVERPTERMRRSSTS